MPSLDFADSTAFARLLAEARAGSPDALGHALMEHRDYLLLAASRRLDPKLRRKASASDLVQETFLDALRDFARFQGERAEEWLAWLCQILFRNVANMVRRYCGTEKRAVDRELPLVGRASEGSLLRQAAGDVLTPSERVAAREEVAALESALSRLPKHYRHVLYLRYQEKQTFAQIGEMLSCSAEAARKLEARAVSRLQKMLEPLQESR